MYAVCFPGGLWVLGRIVRRWRIGCDRLTVVSRGDHDG
jgi:hypothetical protein